MATDFSKLMYYAVEDYVKAQMGPDEFKKFDKIQWRKLMDVAMEQFARSIISIVASVARNQYEAKQKVEAAEKAENERLAAVESAAGTPASDAPATPPTEEVPEVAK